MANSAMAMPQPRGATVRSGPEATRSRIVRSIRAMLTSGRFAVGDKFLSERCLAAELGVNRITLRATLRYLDSEGFFKKCANGQRVVAAIPAPDNGCATSSLVFLTSYHMNREMSDVSGWGTNVAFGALQAAIQQRQNLMVVSANDDKEQVLTNLLANPPAGIACDCKISPAQLACATQLAKRGVAVVCLEEAVIAGCDIVMSDQEGGAYKLVEWLITSRHCRRLAIACPDNMVAYNWWQRRLTGYHRALAERGLPPPYLWNVPSLEDIRPDLPLARRVELLIDMMAGRMAPKIRQQPVDALAAVSDGQTFPLAAACQKLGWRVHDDIAIVGYDNYWQGVAERALFPQVPPPVATIDKRNSLCGKRMIMALLDRLQGRASTEPRRIMVEPELIISISP